MRSLQFRLPGLALSALLGLLPAVVVPTLHAQDQPPQPNLSGQGRGYGRGGGMGMGMGGMFGPGGGGTEGTVTAISGDNLTIKNEQGQTFTVETGPNTRVRKNRELAKFSDIRVGDTIMAGGNLDDQAKTVGAMFVMVLDPQQAAQMEKMRATFGKTWTAGRVTAIRDLTLTVERPDKTAQTIAVDENTVFRKRSREGPQDITFPEIKVGDMVRADGSVQTGGNFLATTLDVAEPRQPGQGRFGNRPGAPGGAQQTPQPQGAPAGSVPPPNPQIQ
jgi:hypothetical protein